MRRAPPRLPATRPDEHDLWAQAVLREPLAVAVPLDHELTRGGSASLADLRDQSFIVIGRAGNSPARQMLVDRCQLHGFTPRIGAEAPLAVALQLVAAGEGIAVLPFSTTLGPVPEQVDLVPLIDAEIELFAISNPGHQSLAIAAFLDALAAAGRVASHVGS